MIAPTHSERERQQLKEAARRFSERLVRIPKCEDKNRRRELEADDAAWLQWYCHEIFTHEFTANQLEMIGAFSTSIQYGIDQAIAAPRGDGKTTIAEMMITKYTVQGVLAFAVFFAASGPLAKRSLASIKKTLTTNDRLLADYPEVCHCIRELQGTSNRASTQVVTGYRHDDQRKRFEAVSSSFVWHLDEISLPNVPGSPSAGAIISTSGLESAVRGLKVGNRRPDLVVIDDPDTKDSSRSEEQAAKLEDTIDRDLANLGGQGRRVGRIMLTTLQSRISVSYKFTDPAEKAWNGRRFRFLVEPPQRTDLWDEYIAMRRVGQQGTDPLGREAHRFYLERRDEMDAGAVVANPHRYESIELADGSLKEVSALQHYYNAVWLIGQEAVDTELNNDPPEDTGIVESGITAAHIQRQLSGYERGAIPDGCTVLSIGVDIGKWRLHWVVRAWAPGATGYTIDYGTQDTAGAIYGSDQGLDRVITEAILRLMEELSAKGYAFENGSTIEDPITLVDASYRTDAVYTACIQAGASVFPVMGIGKSVFGGTKKLFSQPSHTTNSRIPGDGWNLERQGKLRLVEADADRWKAWEHDRWMSSGDNGCLFLFGSPPDKQTGARMAPVELQHTQYAAQICSEIEVEEVYKGYLRRGWAVKSKDNHYLDASYYADVGASMRGIRLEDATAKRVVKVGGNKHRKSLSEMAQG